MYIQVAPVVILSIERWTTEQSRHLYRNPTLQPPTEKKKMIIKEVRVGTPVSVIYPGGETYIQITNCVYVSLNYATLDEAISMLQRCKKEYGKHYTNLRFSTVRECDCYHDCGCSPSYCLIGDREETDIEREHRIALNARRERRKEEQDRKDFDRLKAKFGN